MFRGVVFDLDGTLIDSPLCYKHIRRELGIPEGEYILEHLERLPADVRDPKLVALEQIERVAAAAATLIDGVSQILADLREQNVLMGIFTRNCRSATQIALRQLNVQVDMIVTREDAPPKPNPDGMKLFLSAWGFTAPEILFVGDVKFDIECGRHAGVRTALFTNGDKCADSFQADFVFSHYRNFPSFRS